MNFADFYFLNEFLLLNLFFYLISIHSKLKGNYALKLFNNIEKDFSVRRKLKSSYPIVTIAYAQYLDGSISRYDKSQLNISSEKSFQLLHSLRASRDAILIGINTLFLDNPKLNCRAPLPVISNVKNPRPVILDSNLRITELKTPPAFKNPIIFTCVEENSKKWLKALNFLKSNSLGGKIVYCHRNSCSSCDIRECLLKLKSLFNIKSLLVEGGSEIIRSFSEELLVDQIVLTQSLGVLGGYKVINKELSKLFKLKLMDIYIDEISIIMFLTPQKTI